MFYKNFPLQGGSFPYFPCFGGMICEIQKLYLGIKMTEIFLSQ